MESVLTIIRPNTLLLIHHKKHQHQFYESINFIREAFTIWKSSSNKLSIVPDEQVQNVFFKLNLHPTSEQVNDMLQIAKLYTSTAKYCNGLGFGEFCVLAADFRKFRTLNGQPNTEQVPFRFLAKSPRSSLRIKKNISLDQLTSPTTTLSAGNGLNGMNGFNSSVNGDNSINRMIDSNGSKIDGPEVFLGGSCNPTTWRADVAIPALSELGISFYNPQVSQWTPDLIELEHRAKEKARVLFFVMDSETRASAGAIEAAHIAGQNTKHLVLVLHPYKVNQTILNETISEEEYLDLSRNQKLLKQLVTRRGLPVLDSIPSGLQKIKGILSGEPPCRTPPLNVGSRLLSVRRSYDRVIGNSCEVGLTLSQCHQALSTLGFRKNLLSIDNLKQIIQFTRDVLSNTPATSENDTFSSNNWTGDNQFINFDEFCILSSYLAVLQQEINENSCVSPIKGTNLPPPPVFLTNAPELIHNQSTKCISENQHHIIINHSMNRQLARCHTVDGSGAAVLEDPQIRSHPPTKHDNRDSGTSSPQPNEIKFINSIGHSKSGTRMPINVEYPDFKINGMNGSNGHITNGRLGGSYEDLDSDDSNDSVFSTGSSLEEEHMLNFDQHRKFDVKDIYLGGSCMLRTRWRQELAIPYLKSRHISFYLPTLHENLTKLQLTKRMKHKDGESSNHDSFTVVEGKPSNEEPSTGGSSLMYNPNVLDSSRLLLFIITNETRSLAPMTLAAHYIGLGYNVVLCVQMLPENCNIGNDQLTPSAIKDYNRGRSYLTDLAKRQGIPVFHEIKDALKCAIDKVKLCKPRCSV